MIGCSCSVLHVFVVSLFDMMSPLNVEFMCLFLTLFRTGIGTKTGANLSMFICPSLFLRRFISDWISLSVLKCHLFLKFSFHGPSFFFCMRIFKLFFQRQNFVFWSCFLFHDVHSFNYFKIVLQLIFPLMLKSSLKPWILFACPELSVLRLS